MIVNSNRQQADCAEEFQPSTAARHEATRNAAEYLSKIRKHWQEHAYQNAEKICAEAMRLAEESFELEEAWVECALRRTDYDEAVTRARNLLEKFPASPLAWLRLFNIYLFRGEYVLAEEIIKDGMARMPDAPELLLGYARLAMARGDYETAIVRLETFGQKYSANPIWIALTIDCYLEMKQYDKALELCAASLASGGNSFHLLPRKANILIRLNRYTEAAEVWKQYLQTYPGTASGYMRMADIFILQGDVSKAEEFARAGVEKTNNSLECLNFWASMPLRFRQYDQTVLRAMEVIKKYPQEITGYLKAAEAARACMSLSLAEDLAKRACAVDPCALTPRLSHAEILAKRGEQTLYRKELEQIVARFPFSAQPYLLLIGQHMNMAEFGEAEQVCRLAMQKFPANPDVHARYAEIAMRQRNYPEARCRWQDVRTRFPFYPAGYSRGAVAYMDDEYYGDAEKLLGEALQKMPDVADFWLVACDVLLRKRENDKAAAFAGEMCEKFPYNVHAWFRKYAAHVNKNDYVEAEKACEKAMAYQPNTSLGYIAYATVASKRKQYSAAMERWRKVIELFPYEPGGYGGLIEAQLTAQQYAAAEETWQQAALVFGKEGSKLPLALHLMKMGILLHKKEPCQAALYAGEIYQNDPLALHNPAFIQKLADCATALRSKLKAGNISLADSPEFSVLIAILMKSRIAWENKFVFQMVENYSQVFSLQELRTAIQNVLVSYGIDNIYANCYAKNLDHDSLYNYINSLFMIDFKYVFKMFFLLQNYESGKDIFISMADENVYERYSERSKLLFIRILHYFSPELAWSLSRNLIKSYPENIDASRPEGFLARRVRAKNEWERMSLPRLLTPPRKLSVAICISGQLRGYQKCFPSLFNLFDLEQHSYKVFCHVWKDIGRKFPTVQHAARVFANKFLYAYERIIANKDAFTVIAERYPHLNELLLGSSIISHEQLADFYNTSNIIIEDDRLPPYNSLNNAQKMYYKLEACQGMLNGEKFDLVIRTRPDYLISGRTTYKLSDIYKQCHKNNAVYISHGYVAVPGMGDAYEVSDAFAIGPQEYMDIYSHTYGMFDEYIHKNSYNCNKIIYGHTPLSYMLLANGIDVKPLQHTVQLVDADSLTTGAIYEALQKDLATRTATSEDATLIQACLEDLREENK